MPTQHPPELDLFALNTQAAHSSKTKEQPLLHGVKNKKDI
jgi:hypothetical protein